MSTKSMEALMRGYHQLTSGERYELSALRKQGCSIVQIAQALGRHRTTIWREIRRNARKDGGYRPETADDFARWRRARSRRNWQFSEQAFELICTCLREYWSPDQISGRLRRFGILSISHETIYRYVWEDWGRGGSLHLFLRGARKLRRKRYRSYDSRGRLEGKRHISQRPAGAENRSRFGHVEIDTVMGGSDQHCVLTIVERKGGFVWLGKLNQRTVHATNQCATSLIRRAPRKIRTLTADNGTEFHGYKDIETSTGARFYFATPHHAWERGTSENTNGLIRQFLPKGKSMAQLTQEDCDRIARLLNDRPRKRLGYLTPAEVYEKN